MKDDILEKSTTLILNLKDDEIDKLLEKFTQVRDAIKNNRESKELMIQFVNELNQFNEKLYRNEDDRADI